MIDRDESPHIMENLNRTIHFNYKNHKGTTRTRTVTPHSITFTHNEYHPTPQWLMIAYCHDAKATRTFALNDIYGIATTYGVKNAEEE